MMIMKTFLYIMRVLVQTVIIALLGYFFNTDAHWNFRPTLDGFNIWLTVSFFCQFYIMRSENVLTSYTSLVTQGLKSLQQNDADAYKSQHDLQRYLHGSQANRSSEIQRLQLRDDQFSFVANIGKRVFYALAGPVFTIFFIIKNTYFTANKKTVQ